MNTQSLNAGAIVLDQVLPDSRFINGRNLEVKSCCSQWDECERDDLYVAIVDSEQDGHDFAREAVERGASAIVTERLLAVDRPQCIVPDSRSALGVICQALAGHPSLRVPTFGIAGSDGKTVTSHLIRSVFAQAGRRPGLMSTLEHDLGNTPERVDASVSRPPQLASQLGAMVINGCSEAILEMSSLALAQRAFSGLQLDAAVITNLRTDHLDFHGSHFNVRRATQRILDYLKPTGFAVVNADDPHSNRLLDELDCPALTIGIKQAAEVTARLLERSAAGQTFLIMAGDETAAVRTRTVGDHQLYNCLSAAAVGLACGLDLGQIAKGLSDAPPIPGRMEPVECGQPFGVWVDSSRSPNQLAAALHGINQVTQGDVWCVASTHPGQSEEHRRQIGRVLEKAVTHPVLSHHRVEQVPDYEAIHQVLDGFRNPKRPRPMPNRLNAIEWVLSQARPGDAVVLTGAGANPIACLEGNRWSVTDRDVCQAWLYDQNLHGDENIDPPIFNIDDYR